MGMTNEGTKLPADFARDFPFESRLSLASLIRFWDEQAKDPSVTSPCWTSTGSWWTG